jgi:hypothetical protein
MKLYSNTKHDPFIKILNELFEANPEISAINLNDKCSDCGREIIIEITPTSGIYGLQGGALFKDANDEYIAKCLACYDKHLKIDNNQKNGK